MVMCQKGARSTARRPTAPPERHAAASPQGGPVFLPPRKPSALVWKLLAEPGLGFGVAPFGIEEGGERLTRSA